jgi:hypothetical protein
LYCSIPFSTILEELRRLKKPTFVCVNDRLVRNVKTVRATVFIACILYKRRQIVDAEKACIRLLLSL